MDIPNLRTLDTLERRKKYLLKKESKNASAEKIAYEEAEIKALENILGFTEMVLTKIPIDVINKTIEEYKSENNISGDDMPEDDIYNDHKILRAGVAHSTKNHKVLYSFIERNNRSFILLRGRKFNPSRTGWETNGVFLFSKTTLDKVIKWYKKSVNPDYVIMEQENGGAI